MLFEFGEIRVDVSSRQIWKGSETVHLTRKAFELLILLLKHRPAVVPNEQIHAHLWPETFVTESSVQRLVFEIRQAIGDDGQRQTLLRTVHGMGYAFSGSVVEVRAGIESAPTVRAWLVGAAWKVPLHEGDNVVGRSGDDVTVIDASTISRRHARIIVEESAWVEDLGSKNGTWVRDQRVTERTQVCDGDSVRLDALLFTFRSSHGLDSTDTVTNITG